jgi:oligopeptide/dipeptide ABC transporter ATP-binding protein
VELGPATQVFEQPLHPYTKALVSAVPVPDPDREKKRQRVILQGDPPSPMSPPNGCAFHPRCPYAIDVCRTTIPILEDVTNEQKAACLRVREIGD